MAYIIIAGIGLDGNLWAADKGGEAPLHKCDNLAARKGAGYGLGVASSAIDADSAITACIEAVRSFPETIRFWVWLGRAYFNAKNYAEAATLFRKAADQGYAIAQNHLGVMYETGLGVERNYNEAANWYRKAANQDNDTAQYNLGRIYENGYGVAISYAEAINWYRKAADQGDADARYNLGVMYETGLGVERNYNEAANWYRKAADQGDADAQYNLGRIYENGFGVAKNYIEAANWYRKAADQGNIDAQNKLDVWPKLALEHASFAHQFVGGGLWCPAYSKGEGGNRCYRYTESDFIRDMKDPPSAEQEKIECEKKYEHIFVLGMCMSRDYGMEKLCESRKLFYYDEACRDIKYLEREAVGQISQNDKQKDCEREGLYYNFGFCIRLESMSKNIDVRKYIARCQVDGLVYFESVCYPPLKFTEIICDRRYYKVVNGICMGRAEQAMAKIKADFLEKKAIAECTARSGWVYQNGICRNPEEEQRQAEARRQEEAARRKREEEKVAAIDTARLAARQQCETEGKIFQSPNSTSWECTAPPPKPWKMTDPVNIIAVIVIGGAFWLLRQKLKPAPKTDDSGRRNENFNQGQQEHAHQQHEREESARQQEEHAWQEREQSKQQKPKEPNIRDCWHKILGVEENADFDTIKKAYRDLVHKYHEDKVSHLGDEFKSIAKEKMIKINGAYDYARKLKSH